MGKSTEGSGLVAEGSVTSVSISAAEVVVGGVKFRSVEDFRVAARLVTIVREFRDRHRITCADTCHQTDRVAEDATTFVEDCVAAVGYGRFVEVDEGDDYRSPENDDPSLPDA